MNTTTIETTEERGYLAYQKIRAKFRLQRTFNDVRSFYDAFMLSTSIRRGVIFPGTRHVKFLG